MLAARCLLLNSYLIDRSFLRTLDNQYRRRQIVDQFSLWKERSLVLNKGNNYNGALELGNLDPDCLIWISNVDTFIFLLNSLFFIFRYLYQILTNKIYFIKWRVKYEISWLLIGCSGFCIWFSSMNTIHFSGYKLKII